MAPTCSYFMCKCVTGQKPMFRFPTGHSLRLQAWIDNCGNMTIHHLPKEALRNKYICIDHFEKQYIKNESGKRVQINKLAVPVHYRGAETTHASPDSHVASTSQAQGSLILKVLPPTKTYHGAKGQEQEELDDNLERYTTPKKRKRQANEDTPKCKKLKTVIQGTNKTLKKSHQPLPDGANSSATPNLLTSLGETASQQQTSTRMTGTVSAVDEGAAPVKEERESDGQDEGGAGDFCVVVKEELEVGPEQLQPQDIAWAVKEEPGSDEESGLVVYDQGELKMEVEVGPEELQMPADVGRVKTSPSDERIEKWLHEESSDEDDLKYDECSDVEQDVVPQTVPEESCESDSTIEGDDQPAPIPLPKEQKYSSDNDVPQAERHGFTKKIYFGSNRFCWSSEPPMRPKVQHAVQEKEGIKPAYQDELTKTSTPLDIWQKFFTDEMLEKILLHTNVKIGQISFNYNKQTLARDLDLIELKAFIGLMFYTAVFKENRTPYTSLYAVDGTGREIYRCVMSKDRFEVLLKTIRFDDAETREARREHDASAPISEIFDSFVKRCQEVYSIGSSACIDEMLLSFRGRCRFKIHMPKKPAKFGIKIMCLTDAKSGYLVNAYVCLGEHSDVLNLPPQYQQLRKATQAVIRLVSPIEGSNRNVTTDSWFTSLELIELLKQRQLTFVGTLRKSEREIPPELMPSRRRPVESTIFAFTNDITISSYVPEANKAVITVSSLHHTPKVDETSKKPETMLYYNRTKLGVDVLHRRCSHFSTARRTCRWPLAVFYRLLDVSVSNSYVVRVSTHAERPESRFKFIKTLAEQLVRPHLERRANNLNIHRDLKNSLNRILGHNMETLPALQSNSGAEDRLEVWNTCSTCDLKNKRRTQYMCFECKKPICIKCSNKLCVYCREKL